MKTLSAHVAASALFCILLSATAGSQTLDDVLERYYKARGGKDKLAAISGCIIKGKNVGGGGSNKRAITCIYKSAHKFYVELALQPGIKYIHALNGTIGWNIAPWSGSMEPQPTNEDDVKDMTIQSEFIADDLVAYKSYGTKLTLIGKDELDGSDAYKILATKSNGVKITYYIDADSWLEVKHTVKMVQSGVETEYDVSPSDYKPVNGLLMPFTIDRKYGDYIASSISIDSYDINPTINDSVFEMPKKK